MIPARLPPLLRRGGPRLTFTGVVVTGGPFTIDAQDSYNAGAVKHGSFSAGIETVDSYNAGAVKQEGAS